MVLCECDVCAALGEGMCGVYCDEDLGIEV